jgi:hypothetical protein
MYPLDRGLWGATTRITEMRRALGRRVHLDVVSGTRLKRAWQLARFVAGGRLGGLEGIYVENATTLPGPADLAFLALARLFRIPVVTYVRDAQQLFAEYFRGDSPKRAISRAAFLPLTRTLIGLSDHTTFPSAGLAHAVTGSDHALLLPPGARLSEATPLDPKARNLLFIGGLRVAAHGGQILLDGIALARERGHMVELLCVSRPGDQPPGTLPEWVHVMHLEGPAIDRLLPEVLATVTPYRRTPYNDLAMPVKVPEYAGFARPMIVTDITETARIVRDNACGVVVEDTAEGIAEGIAQIVTADPKTLAEWGRAARAWAEANTWDVRAARVLELLDVPADAARMLQ